MKPSERPKRNVLVKLGSTAGLLAIIGLTVAVLQLSQSVADQRSREQAMATMIAVSEGQLAAQRTLVALQANEPSNVQRIAQIEATIAAFEDAQRAAQATLTPRSVTVSVSTPTRTPSPSPINTSTPTVTSLPTDTATPTSTPVPPPEFYDSFDVGLRPEWNAATDEWASVNGQLVNLKHAVWLRIGYEEWGNYSVEIDVKKISGCSIVILIKANRSLSLAINGYGEMSWRRDGVEIPNTKVESFRFPYKVRISAQGSLITTFRNDQQVGQMNISGYEKGKIGLYCEGTGNTFDDLRVRQLP